MANKTKRQIATMNERLKYYKPKVATWNERKKLIKRK